MLVPMGVMTEGIASLMIFILSSTGNRSKGKGSIAWVIGYICRQFNHKIKRREKKKRYRLRREVKEKGDTFPSFIPNFKVYV
jgi:hypothetical protein